ncbi:hypothetical protein C8R43DRAFT_954320 [Mycena crocata]|nr:hypothetical protein C8R43DRAFT_954320 [Mycena crocata]
MPTTSSTTSLVAGGGDDLDNDIHLAPAPTLAASSSSSPMSSSMFALSGGVLELGPRPRCLRRRRRPRRALGIVSAPQQNGTLLGTPQCTSNALADCDGALRIRRQVGFMGTPARCFPRLNWPRRGSHAPIANMPLLGTGYAPLRQPALAAPDGALQIKLRGELGFFFSIWPVFTPSRRSRLTGAYSGGSLTSPLKNIPHRRFRCPWELSSASSPGESLVETTDWLFYRLSQITAMDVSKPFTSEFLLQTARCLDSAKADSNVWEEFLFNLTYRALEDRDYLRIDLIFVTRHSSKVEQLYTIRWSFDQTPRLSSIICKSMTTAIQVQYYMRLQYLNAKAMLVRSQVQGHLGILLPSSTGKLFNEGVIHYLAGWRYIPCIVELVHARSSSMRASNLHGGRNLHISSPFTKMLGIIVPLRFDVEFRTSRTTQSPSTLCTYEITELQFELNTSPLSVLAFEAEAIRLTVSNPTSSNTEGLGALRLLRSRPSIRDEFKLRSSSRGTQRFSSVPHKSGTKIIQLHYLRQVQTVSKVPTRYNSVPSRVLPCLYIFVLAGAEPRSCERLVSWDDTKTLTQKQEFRLTSHNSAPMPSKPRSVSSHRHTAPSPRQIRVLKECPAVAAPGGPRLSGPPSRIHMNTFIKSTYLHEFCVGSSKFALSAVVRAPHIAPASSPGFKVFQSRSFGLRTLGRTVSQPHQHIYSHPKTLISTYLLQFRADSFEPTLRIVVQTCRIVPGRSRRVGAGTSRRNPGASRPPGAQRIDATNTAARLSVKNGKSDLPPRRRAPIPIGLRSVSALRWSATSPRRIRSLEGLRRPRAEYSVCGKRARTRRGAGESHRSACAPHGDRVQASGARRVGVLISLMGAVAAGGYQRGRGRERAGRTGVEEGAGLSQGADECAAPVCGQTCTRRRRAGGRATQGRGRECKRGIM